RLASTFPCSQTAAGIRETGMRVRRRRWRIAARPRLGRGVRWAAGPLVVVDFSFIKTKSGQADAGWEPARMWRGVGSAPSVVYLAAGSLPRHAGPRGGLLVGLSLLPHIPLGSSACLLGL